MLCFDASLLPRSKPEERKNMDHGWGEYMYIFKSLRLRPPTPEAYGKTADVGTLCIPGSSQRRDPSAALLSSSDRSQLAALNVMLTPVLSLDSAVYSRGSREGAKGVQGVQRLCNQL